MRYEGLKAAVFGASAEGGTGWMVAERLAAEGAEVIVSARSLEGIEKLANKIGGVAKQCDVSKEDDVAALAAFAKEKFGDLDMVINSAGMPFASSVGGSSAEDLMAATQINYFGPFFVIKHMAPLVRAGGGITIITSLAGTNVVEGQVIYGCAKAAANMLVQYACLELGPKNVRVNAVAPGLIKSPLVKGMFDAAPAIMDVYLKEIPYGDGASPEEIANAAIWLASSDCVATGAVLHVTGGNHVTRQPLLKELPSDIMKEIN